MHFVRFLSPGGARWGRLQADTIFELDAPPYLNGRETGQTYMAEMVKLLAPAQPSKIVCIGRNYAEHAAELNNQVPAEPMFFLKAPSALIGPGDAILLPNREHPIHWEAELALVIGRQARQVTPEEALDYVFGYTIACDVSDREYQKTDAPFGFGRAKSFDTFCPCGPSIATRGVDPLDVQITLTCNSQVRQSDSTALMLNSIPKLISFLSGIMTLVPGDLILTGTPKGVGPMKPGDLIEITIPGIGTLSNPVE